MNADLHGKCQVLWEVTICMGLIITVLAGLLGFYIRAAREKGDKK